MSEDTKKKVEEMVAYLKERALSGSLVQWPMTEHLEKVLEAVLAEWPAYVEEEKV